MLGNRVQNVQYSEDTWFNPFDQRELRVKNEISTA